MPELPEVETIRAGLVQRVAGRRFTGVHLLWPGCVDRPDPETFRGELVGRQIEGLDRRGKFLIFRLDHQHFLVVHLRMTGRLSLRDRGAPRHPHLRAVLSLDDGHELHFEDQRKFGRLYLARDAPELDGLLAKVGPEPLLPSFTRDRFRSLLQGRQARLKPLLLDQRFIAGLGNIYVDEALFRAGLHPLRRAGSLTPAEIDRLYDGVVEALRQGIGNRGTTLASYRDAWGAAGLNQERLLVFRRHGRPCPRCARPIEKIRVAGRGTHLCPHCQQPHGQGEASPDDA
jgi:formamidopyrimidine-DNA glycosylase